MVPTFPAGNRLLVHFEHHSYVRELNVMATNDTGDRSHLRAHAPTLIASVVTDRRVSEIYVFLAEMTFPVKTAVLVKLYGPMIGCCIREHQEDELDSPHQIEIRLNEAATRRNRYAHADWSGIKQKRWVRVKTKARKNGVFHTYRQFETKVLEADLEFIEKTHESLAEFDEELRELMASH